jgi:hypothetical protein
MIRLSPILFVAFSSREPGATSLENAMSRLIFGA